MGILWLINVTDTKVRLLVKLDEVLTVPLLGDIPRHSEKEDVDK